MKFNLKILKHSILIMSLLLITSLSRAEDAFIGTWESYDLSNTPRSYVKFYQINNTLQGKIIKILSNKSEETNDTCLNCPSPWKNKKKLGMTIIWGLQKDNDMWKNGYVLDTDSGKIYRCQLTISEDTQTLHFRAYIAQPILGKTIDWKRIN
jgi:uncharacterized protein (DUF2147 family)